VHIISDPFNNRDKISAVAKGELGVYIFTYLVNGICYVGHSINLYNRITSYFMPSILQTQSRRVLRFFNKYGFNGIQLTILVLEKSKYTEENAVELEQFYMDLFDSELNVDRDTTGSQGYHTPMSEEAKLRLRSERGISVYVYSGSAADTLSLLLFLNLKLKYIEY
jgi:group I intron endonuclease